MKTIIFFTPVPPPYGGIGNWTLMIKDYLSSSGDDIKTFFVDTSPNKRDMEGRTIWDRVVYSGFKMISNIREFKKIAKYNQVDAIHINTSGSLALIRDYRILRIAKKKNIRSIFHLRFGRVPELLEGKTAESKRIKKCLQLADRIISLDRPTYSSLIDKGMENVYLIPNPINQHFADNFFFDKKEKSISYLGWIIKTKGIEELILSWNNIKPLYKNWFLKLIGPCKPEYMAYLKSNFDLERVVFCGEMAHDKAMIEIQKSSIFILPSYTEGFPNVILEAMLFGLPIISTRVGQIPEILKDDCGILIDSKNIPQLQQSLDKLLNSENERNHLSSNAKEKCKEYYIDNIVEQYKNIWFS